MTKLNASLSKKLPIPGQAYSCRQYGASVEVELPEGVTAEDIRDRLRSAYALLEAAVDEEFARTAAAGPAPEDENRCARQNSSRFVSSGGEDEGESMSRWDGRGDRNDGGGNGGRGGAGYGRRGWSRQGVRRDGRGGGYTHGSGLASQAQIKAIFGIAKANGIERRDVLERIQEQFRCRRVEDLTLRQASEVIEQLKLADCA